MRYASAAGAPVWSAADATRLADPAALEDLLGAPALVLDLRDTPPPDGLTVTRVPCPVIGLAAPGADVPADVVLVPGEPDTALLGDGVEAAADALVAAAAMSPAAAAVLAQVLRVTPSLPVAQGLLVESAAYSLLLTGPDFRGWLERRTLPRPARDEGPSVVPRRDGDVLELTLNRPSVRNAYDASMRDALVEALSLAAHDRSVRVVLRGRGPSFCSGGDLREFGTSADMVRAHAVRAARSPGALLHAVGTRTEAWVHGACVGAGVELPAFAGRVVARRDATFRLPEVAMGTIPGAGGTVSLPRRIGAGRTLLLALSGLALGAEDALRWGLVDAVVDDLPESGITA